MNTKFPTAENQELRRLSESPLELADPRQEIRGCKVYDGMNSDTSAGFCTTMQMAAYKK